MPALAVRADKQRVTGLSKPPGHAPGGFVLCPRCGAKPSTIAEETRRTRCIESARVIFSLFE
jgi:hypothetical protein